MGFKCIAESVRHVDSTHMIPYMYAFLYVCVFLGADFMFRLDSLGCMWSLGNAHIGIRRENYYSFSQE